MLDLDFKIYPNVLFAQYSDTCDTVCGHLPVPTHKSRLPYHATAGDGKDKHVLLHRFVKPNNHIFSSTYHTGQRSTLRGERCLPSSAYM